MGRKWLGGLTLYAGAAGLCLAALCLVMRLWRADLRVPFRNDEDALVSLSLCQRTHVDECHHHAVDLVMRATVRNHPNEVVRVVVGFDPALDGVGTDGAIVTTASGRGSRRLASRAG